MVQYKGNAPALNALMGGEVNLLFDVVNIAQGQVKSGRVRAIASTNPKRGIGPFGELPVLAETPLASDLESVASLIEERAQRPGPPLIPITPWRFSPDLQLARGILAGGALGDPVSFQVTLPGPEGFLYANGQRLQSPVTAAGVVMHEGWQAFDLVRHLIGEVYSLEATRIRGVNTSPSLEGVVIAVRCSGGWNGKICLSVEPVTPKTHWVSLKGSEGAIELGWDSSSFVPADGEVARIGQGCFGIENYERLANAFADVASSRVDPWMGDIDLMRTMDLMQATQMSLGAGLAVEAPRRQRRIVAA